MDFLIQSGRQWIAQWHEASPASRWTLGFVIALGCGAIVLAIGWPRQEPREFLFDGVEFSRSELTAMEAAFGKSQLNDARIVGRSIEVPQRGKHLYLKALFDQQALPATFFTYAQRSLASDHPFSSPRQREAVAKLAKEQEVALMLRKIAGIEEASVQYEDTDLGGFPRRRQRQATAAVRAQSDRVLEPTVVNAIRVTMMNTLGIADPHSVTVLDLNAGIAHSGPDLTPSPPAAQTVRVAGTTEALPIGFANGDAAPPRGVKAEPSPKEEPAPATIAALARPARVPEVTAFEVGSTTHRIANAVNASPHWRRTTTWLRDNSLTLFGSIVGFWCLVRLASVLKRTRTVSRQARSLIRSVAAQRDSEAQREAAAANRLPTSPPLGRKRLQEQIHQDVRTAAATLRQWLSNAA